APAGPEASRAPWHDGRSGDNWQTGGRRLGAFAGEVEDPVRLPGLAAVGGERLLEVRLVGPAGRPDVADEDPAAFQLLVVEELDVVADLAAHRRRQAERPLVH